MMMFSGTSEMARASWNFVFLRTAENLLESLAVRFCLPRQSVFVYFCVPGSPFRVLLHAGSPFCVLFL
jgi:hypothetical protein